ncbi:hypothetical protein IU459_24135 [Nocardia amamiensis]|uniref:Uncharacterized protein n=1 Tax=Nocardia amamiensis TaxID=404578 RepID=A0ABS0CVH2_9NOCA|nr:hypothetical protein [Nocardia amamiensis]MBF6300609.1 hypothetical protein [Nocardia amamiensis]
MARREPDWATARKIADQLASEAGVSAEDLAWAEEVLGLTTRRYRLTAMALPRRCRPA